VSPSKPTTTLLKRLPGVHSGAGRLAGAHGFPWWCAWSYAAAQMGSTDCQAVHECAVEWLQGWLESWAEANPGRARPKVLTDLVAAPLAAWAVG